MFYSFQRDPLSSCFWFSGKFSDTTFVYSAHQDVRACAAKRLPLGARYAASSEFVKFNDALGEAIFVICFPLNFPRCSLSLQLRRINRELVHMNMLRKVTRKGMRCTSEL